MFSKLTHKQKVAIGLTALILFILWITYLYLKSKNKSISSESSFAPGPGARPRGVFAPVPGSGGGSPPPPMPPAPPSGGGAPPSGPGHDHHHPHPPYPYPYPYWNQPVYWFADLGLSTPSSNQAECYKTVTLNDSRGERDVCMSQREYVIYMKGRLDIWKERLREALNKKQDKTASDIKRKINTIKDILRSEGVNV